MSSKSRTVRSILPLALSLLLVGCVKQFSIPRPVPPAVREHVVGVQTDAAWRAGLRAVGAIGLSAAEVDPVRRALVTDFGTVEGNRAHERNRGVARLAVERDIYSAGRRRLRVDMSSASPGGTRVQVVAEIRARVQSRGEIHYAEAAQQHRFPLLSGDGDPKPGEHEEASGWETLTSNGVLEDEFLAALMRELPGHGSADER